MSILRVLIVTIGLGIPVIVQAQPLPVQFQGTQGKETVDKIKLLRVSCSAAEIIKDAIQHIKQGTSLSNYVDMQGSRLHSPKWRADITGTFDKVTDSQLLMTRPALELFSDRFTPKRDEEGFGGVRQPFDVNNTDQRTFVLTVTGGDNATLNYGAGSTPKAMCAGDYIYTTEGDEFIVLKLTKGQGQR